MSQAVQVVVPTGYAFQVVTPNQGTFVFQAGTYAISAALSESANGSVVKTVGPSLVDSKGNAWSITGGGQVALNTMPSVGTGNVVEIAYVKSVIWQENKFGTWYPWTGTTWGAATATSPLTGEVNEFSPAFSPEF